ncbi:MAG: alkaline phosphatase family protein [Nitrospinae bacterium]|nr:alkaline phosphatase family protein [Nitrospinota bacterium]
MRNRVLVIGLDGATFDLLDPWMDKGELPILAGLKKDGCWGYLRSTFPPLTGVAWASFLSGKGPGRHNIFDFHFTEPLTNELKFTTSDSIRTEKVWDILNRNKKTIGAINVPLTYPPEQVKGFMIAGINNPGKDIFYPKELEKELIDRIGNYYITANWRDTGLSTSDFINMVKDYDQKRGEAGLYLMDRYDCDFFIILFCGTDRLQHRLWHLLDPQHKRFKREDSDKYYQDILSYYKLLDHMIGDMMNKVKEDTSILIISDHGFGPLKKIIFINDFLREKGFIQVKHSRYSRNLVNKGLKMIRGVGRRMNLGKIISKDIVPRKVFNRVSYIEWDRTYAYCNSETSYGIYINLKGREPFGIVNRGSEYEKVRDRVIHELKGIKDDETGEYIVDEVFKKEDICSGPYLDNAPDIYINFKNMEYKGVDFFRKEIELPPYDIETGGHRMEGIFISHGKNLKKGLHVKDINIMDMMPTILYLFGDISIPEGLDGRVIKEIFTQAYLENVPIRYTKSEYKDGPQIGVSPEDRKRMEEQLRGLGYLG